jgi:hypothetical protein
MPKYKFHVINGSRYEDPIGTDLPNDKAAVAEGAKVAREVKSDRELDAQDWMVEIKDGQRTVENIPFNAVD